MAAESAPEQAGVFATGARRDDTAMVCIFRRSCPSVVADRPLSAIEHPIANAFAAAVRARMGDVARDVARPFNGRPTGTGVGVDVRACSTR